MNIKDFKPGRIIKHALMSQSLLGKSIYAIVPPKGYIINPELKKMFSEVSTKPNRAFGVDALGKIAIINGDTNYKLASVKDILEIVQPKLQDCKDLQFKIKWDLNETGDSIENVYFYDLTYKGIPVYTRKINAFDRVIVKVGPHNDWAAAFYSHQKDSIDYILGGIPVKECVLYEGNEHLLNQ